MKPGSERKLILYIAVSLDGYIADPRGGIGFLDGISMPGTYGQFYGSVDTIIMGNTTYRQIKYELSPDAWPYRDKPVYVYTRKVPDTPGDEGVFYTDRPPEELLGEIREKPGGDIWLMGGGTLVKAFLEKSCIDELMIYIIPCLLGEGIPLFPPEFPETGLVLKSCTPAGDSLELIYTVKR